MFENNCHKVLPKSVTEKGLREDAKKETKDLAFLIFLPGWQILHTSDLSFWYQILLDFHSSFLIFSEFNINDTSTEMVAFCKSKKSPAKTLAFIKPR